MNVIFNKNYAKESERAYTEEELIFLDELTDTMKFQSFVNVFLQSYNPIDLYKIPLTFTEEFLSIISRKKEQMDQNVKKIDFFNLIDSLYISDKRSEKTCHTHCHGPGIQPYFRKKQMVPGVPFRERQ